MSNAESVTSCVSLLWHPPRYRVTWAHTPQDVPEFDVSRGANPYVGLSEDVVALRDDLQALKAGLQSKYGGDAYIAVPSTDPALGGGKPPPPAKRLLVTPLVYTASGPEEPEVDAYSNYPRLVRKTSQRVEMPPVPQRELVCKAIADLDAYSDDDKCLMKAIVDLVKRFAVLGFLEHQATLNHWRTVISEFRFHLSLLAHLSKLRDEFTASELHAYFTDAVREWLHDSSSANPHPAPTWRWMVEAKSKLPPQDFLKALSTAYWQRFELESRHSIEVAQPGYFRVNCGSQGWGYKELWEVCNNGRPVRLCRGCGAPYVPYRADQWHCASKCRVKAHRNRLRRGE